MRKALALLLSAVMAVTVGATVLACGGEPGKDGINGVNGIDGADGAPGKDGLSAYELYIKAHPEYKGSEEQWLAELAGGSKSSYEYSVVSYGRNFGGTLTAGTASSNGSTMSFENAVVKLDQNIIMPTAEDAEWEINIGGVLANGGASAELLASLDKTVTGRVYFGVYADNNIAYLGVNEGGFYFNYCWDVPGATIKSSHEYTVRYKDGTYTLSVDGGSFDKFTKLNYNQSGTVNITDAKVASADLNAKIRAVNGQDYFEWTSIGADSHKVSCKIDYLDVKTSAISDYETMSKHPLYGKTIYHLGSSISYGYTSGGKSFAEQISELTGSKYVKETVSGTTLVGNVTPANDSYVSRFEKFNFGDNPAFLMLQLSTNDFSQNKPTGTVTGSNVTSGFDTSTICGAIEHIISETKRKSPDTKVVIYTCAIRNSWGNRTKYGAFVNATLKMIQAKWDIIVVDLFNLRSVNTDSWMSDDIHPSAHEYANKFTPNMINVLVDALK